jgi:Flp pilus assembly protein TadG
VRSGRRRDHGSPHRGDGGQAAVEFALVLPLLAALLLVLVQVGLLVRDQVLVIHAAREAVRQVAVQDGAQAAAPGSGPRSGSASAPAPTPRAAAAEERIARAAAIAATGTTLDPSRLEVAVEARGGKVGVRVGYRAPIGLPIPWFGRKDVRLVAFAQMTREID